LSTWRRFKFCLAMSFLASAPLALYMGWQGLLVPGGLVSAGTSFFFLGLALAGGFAAGLLLSHRLERQVDLIIDYCHRLTLSDPGHPVLPARNLGELGRLAITVQYMRDALVDFMSLYRRFFEAAPDMFLTLSPAGGRILDANQAFSRTLGLLSSEVLGHRVHEFVELERGWDAVLQGLEGLHKGQMRTYDATIKIEASVSREYGPKGQQWVLGAMLRDVTRREELHRQILAKSTALENALKEIKSVEGLKDQFLTTLSHELKTPMVSLKGFLDLLKQGGVEEAERRRYLDICWRNLLKLEKQINDLLDLARLSQGGEQFEMLPVDLADLVCTEAENLRPLADSNRVSIAVNFSGRFMVRGNPEKLTQLVDNLLLNAVKYNREGGEVEATFEDLGDKRRLIVSDSGVGMDREHLSKIFNRFYRADVSGTGRIEGLGIGLSLVQEIVRLHEGDISVESQPGVGTSFTVDLEPAP
jgi:two-component system phosphate regulon sensor histidine kinase PhoR